jgi:peroxiredoxin Q/BCP
MLSVGNTAPDFTLPCDGGGQVTLSALKPSRVVIFFYGQDGTPSCTAEVMDFNGLLADFTAAGVKVIGVSKDKVAAHDRFKAKMGIGMTLASDFGGTMMESWGAFGDKIFFGKPVVGVLRSTVLIGGDGALLQRWSVDKVKGHAAQVLDAVRAL